jgi:hypothetical protein
MSTAQVELAMRKRVPVPLLPVTGEQVALKRRHLSGAARERPPDELRAHWVLRAKISLHSSSHRLRLIWLCDDQLIGCSPGDLRLLRVERRAERAPHAAGSADQYEDALQAGTEEEVEEEDDDSGLLSLHPGTASSLVCVSWMSKSQRVCSSRLSMG